MTAIIVFLACMLFLSAYFFWRTEKTRIDEKMEWERYRVALDQALHQALEVNYSDKAVDDAWERNR